MTPPKYADGTDVPVAQSKAEIESLLTRHGSSGFLSGADAIQGYEFIHFRFGDCAIAKLIMPIPTDKDFPDYKGGADKLERAIRNEHKRRWRVLLITVKAKLEFIKTGLSTFEREFLGDLLLPDGTTLSQKIAPQIEAMYKSGKMPRLLGPGKL
jgi:hypothetical protein